MNSRRLTTTGIALVAVLGLGLTGCGGRADAPAGRTDAASAAVDAAHANPTEELTAAVHKLNEQSMRITLSSSLVSGDGVQDPVSRTMDWQMNMSVLGEMRTVVIGDDAYVRISGMLGAKAGGSKKWLHLDATKLGANGQLSIMPADDPGGVNKLVNAVVDVRRTGDGAFAGTLDYSRTGVSSKALAAVGDKAKQVPFTAKVDGQGRLTQFVLDTTAFSPMSGKMTISYFDFGTPVAVRRPPAAETEEAPAELATAFGS